MSLMIKNISESEWPLWNKFILDNKLRYTIAHNPCLGRVFNKYFNWSYSNTALIKNDEIISIFPYVRKVDEIISMPHLSYGGVLTNVKEQQYINLFMDMVFKHEDRRFKDRNIKNIELRLFARNLPFIRNSKVSSFCSLPETSDLYLSKLNVNVRRKIKKSLSIGVEVKRGGVELLKDFYSVYTTNMHRLGSPAPAYGFFETFVDNYCNGEIDVFVAYKDGKPIGCSLSMSYLQFTENVWFATLQEDNKYYVSYALHWAMIKEAITNGSTTYSFGRSSFLSGTHYYKRQWGVEDHVLYWNYKYDPGVNVKDYKILSKMWKKIPTPLVKKFGPLIGDYLH